MERREVGVTLTARGGTDYTGGRRQRDLSLQTSERWRVDFSVSSSSRAASSLIFSIYGQHTVTRHISVFRLQCFVLFTQHYSWYAFLGKIKIYCDFNELPNSI